MATNDEFFRGLGVEPPDDEGWNDGKEQAKESAMRSFKDIIMVCGMIRTEAIQQGFSSEEAYDFAMSYYGMFLSANFQVALNNQERGRGGEEEG